jgi:hypothetical protein
MKASTEPIPATAAAPSPVLLELLHPPLSFVQSPLGFVQSPLSFVQSPLGFLQVPLGFLEPLLFRDVLAVRAALRQFQL